MSTTSFLSALLLAALLPLSALGGQTLHTVKTTLGNVTGFVDGNTYQYWNIPFAKPPIGSLRWAPPQPLTAFPTNPWMANNNSDYHSCDYPSMNTLPNVEDCLYVTIEVPTTPPPSGGYPVLVFIFGGGFTFPAQMEESGWVGYTQSFIYVSLNYRLGVFGWFPQSDVRAENVAKGYGNYSGNQGLLDMVSALTFVKQHITSFGGNPSKVTVSGESAGSIAVCHLLLAPAAAGLFRGAIMESGGCGAPIGIGGSVTQREADVGAVVTQASSCASTTAGAARLACLRALDFDTLSGLQNTVQTFPGVFGGQYGPIWDGIVIPGGPTVQFANGKFNKVPILLGTNNGEAGYELFSSGNVDYGYTFQSVVDFINIYSSKPATTTAIEAFYSNATVFPNASNIDITYIFAATAATMQCPMRTLARAMSAAGQPVYHYQWSFVDPNDYLSFLNVSVHSIELQYMWNQDYSVNGQERQAAAKQTQNYWLRFVVAGSPNTAIPADSLYKQFFPTDPLVTWTAYTIRDNTTMRFQNWPAGANHTHFHLTVNADGGQCDLWDRAVEVDFFTPIQLTLNDSWPVAGATHIGCYQDNPTRAMFFVNQPSNPDECKQLVLQAGISSIFALQDGDQCFAANSSAEYAQYGTSTACLNACGDNPHYECGGPYANDVYQINPTPVPVSGSTFIGCFDDSGTRAMPRISGSTPQQCAATAKASGLKYWAIQFGSECYGGNSGYATYGTGNPCNVLCSGSELYTCGGAYANQVYELQ